MALLMTMALALAGCNKNPDTAAKTASEPTVSTQTVKTDDSAKKDTQKSDVKTALTAQKANTNAVQNTNLKASQNKTQTVVQNKPSPPLRTKPSPQQLLLRRARPSRQNRKQFNP